MTVRARAARGGPTSRDNLCHHKKTWFPEGLKWLRPTGPGSSGPRETEQPPHRSRGQPWLTGPGPTGALSACSAGQGHRGEKRSDAGRKEWRP